MKKWRLVEVTTCEGDLTKMITDSIDEDKKNGWSLNDIKYSTTFDPTFAKVRSCALIIMERGDE